MDPATATAAPPNVVLMRLVQGVMVSKALQAAAELGIADLLARSPRSVDDLAHAAAVDPSALYRLLRALASLGIFRENEAGCFEQTALSEPLRRDSPTSVRDYILFAPHDGNVRAWMRLLPVLQTGEPSFTSANGCGMWEYLQRNPRVGERFHRAMTALSTVNNPMVLQSCDFSPFTTIIDVGGGHGLFLASVLEANPHLRGTLFDLPGAVDGAGPVLAARGVSDRCEIVTGDAFESIPAGFDAYVLKHVLHDWNDERCGALLEQCRAAIPSHGKLIIVDAVVVPGNDPHPAKWFDLQMMVALGGRERTADEFGELLRRAGFEMTRVQPAPAMVGVVEAVPA